MARKQITQKTIEYLRGASFNGNAIVFEEEVETWVEIKRIMTDLGGKYKPRGSFTFGKLPDGSVEVIVNALILEGSYEKNPLHWYSTPEKDACSIVEYALDYIANYRFRSRKPPNLLLG